MSTSLLDSFAFGQIYQQAHISKAKIKKIVVRSLPTKLKHILGTVLRLSMRYAHINI